MAKVVHKCPTCGKPVMLKGEMSVGNLFIRSYECGHAETVMGVSAAQEDTLNITSLDGKKPFKYQLEGGRFLEAANGRALIADEMGLGKTIQAGMFLVAHPECRPAYIFCKAGLRVQWGKELVRWGDLIFQVVEEGSSAFLLPGFDGYIISLDSAWRIGTKPVTTKEDGKKKTEYVPIPGKTLPDLAKKLEIKSVVIDECQLIKNGDSKRTKAIQDVCRDMEHIIGLSGTPIKNNAAEYFPILNILRPDKFPNRNNFLYQWCDTYFDGYKSKTGGLKDPQRFLNYTKDFIIRRTRAEVLPDLPLIFRQFQFCELGDMVEDMYKETFKEFQDMYLAGPGSATAFEFQSNILAYLSKMRHLAGLAKIDPICEFVEQFILTTDRKLAIFIHHKDVGETLQFKLTQMAKEFQAEWGKGILQMTSAMDSYQRDEIITKFKSPDYRVAIFSTLAAGEGLNMQFCSDCIIGERQWNPANEEQAEARFPRPGQTADKINANYFVAVGTVDEFFSELVEQKREIVNSALNGQAGSWNETSLVKELAQVLAEKGGKKWGW